MTTKKFGVIFQPESYDEIDGSLTWVETFDTLEAAQAEFNQPDGAAYTRWLIEIKAVGSPQEDADAGK